MAPLQTPAKLGAASAPLSVALLERYPHGAGSALFPRRPLMLCQSGAGGGSNALLHNKRMHATARKRESYVCCMGRRVIPALYRLNAPTRYYERFVPAL
jgi:hypothetical protein